MHTRNAIFLRLVCGVSASVFILVSPLSALRAHAAPLPQVTIGEVAWAGSSLSLADEWLELWNLGDTPVPLEGWKLRGAGESGSDILFPSGAAIPAHAAYLVANYASKETKSALATDADLVTTSVSLSNSQLKIELLDPNGIVVDTAGSGGAPPAGSSSSLKISMLRSDPSSTEASAWISATMTQNMKPSISDIGTPGFCDGCSVANTPETSAEPIMTPTTTEDLPSVTSTDIVPTFLDGATTSTDLTEATALNSASTTELTASSTDIALPTDPTPAVVIPSTSAAAPEKPKPNYHMLRLNEVVPYPASGKEWIEVITLDREQKISLKGCTLQDAGGVIHTIGTKSIDPAKTIYTSVTLTKAVLPNTNGSMSLYAPDGQLIDTMHYESAVKGTSWIRFPDTNGAWQMTASTTQNAANALVALPITTDVPQMDATESNEGPELAPAPPTAVEAVVTEDTEDAPTSTPEYVAPKTTKTMAAVKPNTKKTKTKSAASAKTIKTILPIHTITFDMITQDSFTDVRVRLNGRVGSQPGLTASHSFILHNPDGRGLIVSLPTKMRLPAFGNDVTVIGSLLLNDKGMASLKIGTKDQWQHAPTSTYTITPRVVDLLAPAAEDAWSLIRVTGTVMSVNGSNVHLDLGDAEADVMIKPIIRYRAKRLVTGDTLIVTGLLDLTRDDPRIIPRSAEDIVLIQHAVPKTATVIQEVSPQSPIIPGWAPVGAAGGAIVLTEGAKHIHRRRKIKLLERRLAEF